MNLDLLMFALACGVCSYFGLWAADAIVKELTEGEHDLISLLAASMARIRDQLRGRLWRAVK